MTVSFQEYLVCMAIGVFSVREKLCRRDQLGKEENKNLTEASTKTQAENEVSQ